MPGLRFTLGLIAAAFLVVAGVEMRGIESVAGDTINEAFYQAVGLLSWGLAVASIAVTLPVEGFGRESDRVPYWAPGNAAEKRADSPGLVSALDGERTRLGQDPSPGP